MASRRAVPFALGAALLAWPGLALHAQSLYQQRVEVSSGVEHDANPALTSDSKGGVTRWRVSPSYSLLRRDGPDDLTLKLGTTLEQSSNTALSRDRRDGNALGEWQHASEKTLYVLRAGVEQSALRDVLLQETGQLSTDGTRTTRRAEATAVHQLDDIHTLSAGLNARWDRYTSGTAPDGRQYGLNAEFSRAIRPGRDVYLSGSLSSFASDNLVPGTSGSLHTLMRGLSVGNRYAAPDDPWSWDVRVGASRLSGATGDTMATAVGQLAYKAPRWSAAVSIARQPVPDSLRGTFSPNQQARVTLDYALTEFTRVALDASYNRTKNTQIDTSRELGLRVSTELSPAWSMALQVRRIRVSQDAMALPTRAGSTVTGLVLTYLNPDF